MENEYVEEWKKRRGDIIPIDMPDLINKESKRKQFISFINWLTVNSVRKNRISFFLNSEQREILVVNLYQDSFIEFDDQGWCLHGLSTIGNYEFNIPYEDIKTVYVSIIGKYKGD